MNVPIPYLHSKGNSLLVFPAHYLRAECDICNKLQAQDDLSHCSICQTSHCGDCCCPCNLNATDEELLLAANIALQTLRNQSIEDLVARGDTAAVILDVDDGMILHRGITDKLLQAPETAANGIFTNRLSPCMRDVYAHNRKMAVETMTAERFICHSHIGLWVAGIVPFQADGDIYTLVGFRLSSEIGCNCARLPL